MDKQFTNSKQQTAYTRGRSREVLAIAVALTLTVTGLLMFTLNTSITGGGA